MDGIGGGYSQGQMGHSLSFNPMVDLDKELTELEEACKAENTQFNKYLKLK